MNTMGKSLDARPDENSWRNRSWHADIKPDNILRINGEFKLADFGFAKFERKSDGYDVPQSFIEGGTETYGKIICPLYFVHF